MTSRFPHETKSRVSRKFIPTSDVGLNGEPTLQFVTLPQSAQSVGKNRESSVFYLRVQFSRAIFLIAGRL
jgi:hypothetical protein